MKGVAEGMYLEIKEGDGKMQAVPETEKTLNLVTGGAACAGWIRLCVEHTRSGSNRDKYRRRSETPISRCDRIRTYHGPRWSSSRGHRAVEPTAGGWVDGRKQARRAQLHRVRWSREQILTARTRVHSEGGILINHDVVRKAGAAEKHCFPAAVIPPRIELDGSHYGAVDAYADSTGRRLASI